MVTILGLVLMLLLNPITLYGVMCLVEEFFPQNRESRRKQARIRHMDADRRDELYNAVYFCPQCGTTYYTSDIDELIFLSNIDLDTEKLERHCECGCTSYKRSSLTSCQWENIKNAIVSLQMGTCETKEECIQMYEDDPLVQEVIMGYYDQYQRNAAHVWFFDKYVRPLNQTNEDDPKVLRILNRHGMVSDEEYYAKGGAELEARIREEDRKQWRKIMARTPHCPKCGSNKQVVYTGYIRGDISTQLTDAINRRKGLARYNCSTCQYTFYTRKR